MIPAPRESVILVHGLWMRGFVFFFFQRKFEQHGFVAHRFSYPSWSGSLTSNAQLLATHIAQTPGIRVHLVGHSLGGIITALALNCQKDSRIKRLILMGAPWTDCYGGAYLARKPVLAPALGRSIRDWLDCPRPTIPAEVEVGVIAGNRRRGLGALCIPGLPTPNDGVVTVAETYVPGARDSIVLPVSHSGMLFSSACAHQAINFLGSGQFLHA